LLASVRPRDEIGRLRRQLAAELLAELVALDKKVCAIEAEVRVLVRSTPTGLPTIYGVGPVITALTLGEVGDIARFADRNHFASYNGTAPDDKGSAGSPAHCVNIKGNRKLNHAIHMIAITQIRNRKSPGRAYYDRKLAQSKTKKEALRALKRRISDVIYRQLVVDAQHAVGPGGQTGTTLTASVTDPTPTAGTSDKPQPGPNPNLKCRLTEGCHYALARSGRCRGGDAGRTLPRWVATRPVLWGRCQRLVAPTAHPRIVRRRLLVGAVAIRSEGAHTGRSETVIRT
jgi:hypothetical protein